MREIIFYRTQIGECPIEKFLDALSTKQAKEVTWVLQLVETLNIVPIQYFKKLDARTIFGKSELILEVILFGCWDFLIEEI